MPSYVSYNRFKSIQINSEESNLKGFQVQKVFDLI